MSVASRNESLELGQANKAPVTVDHGVTTENDNNSVYNQTRTRKVFSFSQLFAFSLTYMALWEGMCSYVSRLLVLMAMLTSQKHVLCSLQWRPPDIPL